MLDAQAGQGAADLHQHVLGRAARLSACRRPSERSVYKAWGNPWVTSTLQSAAITVAVDSGATSWA
jgi:hypothetical protein